MRHYIIPIKKVWGRFRWYTSRAFARQVVIALRHTGTTVHCPICGWHGNAFYSPGEIDPLLCDHTGRLCPRCYSKDRHRYLCHYLKSTTTLFTQPTRLLEIGPEHHSRLLYDRLSHVTYAALDYSSKQANTIADAQSLPFASACFDLAICYHVFEHLPNDRLAMSELRRVLKPQALLLASVPIFGDTTFEDPSVTDPAMRLQLFGQEDHLRIYGKDFIDRLTDAGFNVSLKYARDLFPAQHIQFYGMLPDDVIHECRT
jgi:SAM-dependent methyltransferase